VKVVIPPSPDVIQPRNDVIPPNGGIHGRGCVSTTNSRKYPMLGIPTVYILANKPHGTLYTGVTSQLTKRLWQHREGCADGFTKRYGIMRLVWYEQHADMVTAIKREKTIKRWPRRWKFSIIQGSNPEWKDLWSAIVER